MEKDVVASNTCIRAAGGVLRMKGEPRERGREREAKTETNDDFEEEARRGRGRGGKFSGYGGRAGGETEKGDAPENSPFLLILSHLLSSALSLSAMAASSSPP